MAQHCVNCGFMMLCWVAPGEEDWIIVVPLRIRFPGQQDGRLLGANHFEPLRESKGP